MSNEARLFQTVARMITKFLPGMLEANRVSLAYLITGIIGSKSVQLSQVANKVVYAAKETSLVERFRRFLQNEHIVVRSEFSALFRTHFGRFEPGTAGFGHR